MTILRRLLQCGWLALMLFPAAALAQRAADRFTIEDKTLSIRADRGFVEVVAKAGVPIAARPALVQTMSVTPAGPSRFRALVHPDSLAHFLDSAEAAIAERRIRSPNGYADASTGSGATFMLSFGEGPPMLGRWLGVVRVKGCSAPGVDSNVDSVTYHALLRSFRHAIREARAWRQRERRTVDLGVACGARLLAQSVIVPTIARRDAGTASSVNSLVDVLVDSNGAVSRLAWRRSASGLATLDSAMRHWRFQPATGARGRRADRVTFRVRYGIEDPRVDLDSLEQFLAPSPTAATRYSVVGHVIDEHSTQSVSSGDVRLHVDDGGVRIGAPVVIALGAGGRVSQLSAMLEHLRQQRRVITYDPRGHGQSTAANDYSIESQTQDLITVLDSLHLDTVVLAGVGCGGIAAAEVARRQPQRVIGVALLAPAGDYLLEDKPRANVIDSVRREMTLSGPPSALSRFFSPGDSLLLAWVVRDLRSTPRDAVLGILESSSRYDFAPAMTEYHGPRMILLTAGTTGPLRPPLAAAPDGILRETFSGSRWWHVTGAAEVARRLETFVYAAEWIHRQ